jgi:hypothetical protein
MRKQEIIKSIIIRESDYWLYINLIKKINIKILDDKIKHLLG